MRSHFNFHSYDVLVYVPSISLGPLTRKYLSGIDYFQERNYYLAANAANGNTSVVFVTSEEIRDTLFSYHLDYVKTACSLKKSDLEKIHTIMISTKPGENLSHAVRTNPSVLRKIRSIVGSGKAVLDFWIVTDQECVLAAELNLPGHPRHRLLPHLIESQDSYDSLPLHMKLI